MLGRCWDPLPPGASSESEKSAPGGGVKESLLQKTRQPEEKPFLMRHQRVSPSSPFSPVAEWNGAWPRAACHREALVGRGGDARRRRNIPC